MCYEIITKRMVNYILDKTMRVRDIYEAIDILYMKLFPMLLYILYNT